MRTLLRPLVVLLAVTFALLGANATAQAATTLVYQEVTQPASVRFIPSTGPDPRGAGSRIITRGDLLQNGRKVGIVDVDCITTRKVGNDYYGDCREVLSIPGGALFARGEINESALERFVPQTVGITGGAGVYAGRTGSLRIQQTRFPDLFTLTATLR